MLSDRIPISLMHGMAVFVEQHIIVASKTVLFGSMASIVTRERMLRQAFMNAVSPDVQEMLRATIPDGLGIILDMLHAVLLFKYREDKVWSDLHRIDASLYAKKPPRMLLRLWRDRMTRARGDRLAMTGAEKKTTADGAMHETIN